MDHYTEEELVLSYYGESAHAEEIKAHLSDCDRCRGAFTAIEEDLEAIGDLPFPSARPGYAQHVWEAIEPRLETQRVAVPASRIRRWRAPLAAAASLILVVTSLWIGYRAGARGAGDEIIDQETRRQALMTAVSLHLQRSERLLVELSNVDRSRNIDLEGPQKRAIALASTNRLYRRTAELHDETELSTLLDELERVLLDVANAPDRINPADFSVLWSRVERNGLLIKMRLQEVAAREGRAAQQI
jgi:hypothetical protein